MDGTPTRTDYPVSRGHGCTSHLVALLQCAHFGIAIDMSSDNRNVARMALLLAGYPQQVAGITVNRLCASGLDAIVTADRAIRAGAGDIYVSGGVESMSRAPFVVGKAERAFDRSAQMYDTAIGWRFPNARLAALFPLEAMGETAENIAEQTQISRERQDVFALESQRRAIEAINIGTFLEEITPVSVARHRQEPRIVDTDEHPRMKLVNGHYEPATDLASLGRLQPAFRKDGTVTAGNASGVNDGAAALLLMEQGRSHELGLMPMVRIVDSAAAGVDPRTMGLGPIPATRKVLSRTGLTVADLDSIELNEAFAVQALAVMDALELPPDRTNVNGGAIALGHPLGCTGARLMTSLIYEMKRRHADGRANSPYGLVTLCVGVGQGVATIVEWIGD